MKYIQGWLVNFLVIFFANHVIPGIVVKGPHKLPHIGGEIPFALVLALLNSLIYPVLRLVDKGALLTKTILATIILNFSAYALIRLIPIDLRVESIEGYFIASTIVTVGSILAHIREIKKTSVKTEPPPGNP